MKTGLPTKTVTVKGKRYRLHMCHTNRWMANQESQTWRRHGYLARVVTFDGTGVLPKVNHYCVYYHKAKR